MSVSKCLLHCPEQTESKYGETLVHSDGLTKHSLFGIVENLSFLFLSNVLHHTFHRFFASECHSRALGLFSTQFCDAMTCLVVTVLDLPPQSPKSRNVRIGVLSHSDMILVLQELINVMFS